jgi:DNA adenine methylase
MPDYLAGYVTRLLPAAARLAGVSLENLPALDLIAKYGKHPNVLLYVDPPYLGSTRVWGNQYRHELRSDRPHRAARRTPRLPGLSRAVWLRLPVV